MSFHLLSDAYDLSSVDFVRGEYWQLLPRTIGLFDATSRYCKRRFYLPDSNNRLFPLIETTQAEAGCSHLSICFNIYANSIPNLKPSMRNQIYKSSLQKSIWTFWQ